MYRIGKTGNFFSNIGKLLPIFRQKSTATEGSSISRLTSVYFQFVSSLAETPGGVSIWVFLSNYNKSPCMRITVGFDPACRSKHRKERLNYLEPELSHMQNKLSRQQITRKPGYLPRVRHLPNFYAADVSNASTCACDWLA